MSCAFVDPLQDSQILRKLKSNPNPGRPRLPLQVSWICKFSKGFLILGQASHLGTTNSRQPSLTHALPIENSQIWIRNNKPLEEAAWVREGFPGFEAMHSSAWLPANGQWLTCADSLPLAGCCCGHKKNVNDTWYRANQKHLYAYVFLIYDFFYHASEAAKKLSRPDQKSIRFLT